MDHFVQSPDPSIGVQCEGVSLKKIATEVGTPAYVYSVATLKRHCEKIVAAFSSYPTTPCFAVKCNSNLSILKEVFGCGLGADLVSLGELQRAILAGVDPAKVVFSGVGKSAAEIHAGLEAGILSFNVESTYELDLIELTAKERSQIAPVCLRINPNVNAKTHPKIATGMYGNKFGLTEEIALALIEKISKSPHLKLVGLACHIGSQIIDLSPLKEASTRMASLCATVKDLGHDLQFIDMGGGLGIRYEDENPPPLEEYAHTIIEAIRPTGLHLIIEPGRVIAGNTGVLLTEVMGVKMTPKKNFVIVDAAMNDLSRPSVYDAYHAILPAHRNSEKPGASLVYDIVGPICESGDYLGKDRDLPAIERGDLLMVRSCGAYAASMASNYNSRARAPEILVDGATYKIVRERESLESLWRSELAPLRS